MSDIRREIEIDSNQYHCPNANWSCGRESDGVPCPSGPTKQGHCTGICQPVKLDDRYVCGNSSKLSGHCDDGPLADGTCCSFPAQCKPRKAGKTPAGEPKFECTRGECLDGPRPDGSCSGSFGACRPKRSIRSRRKIVTIAVTGFAMGALMIALGVSGPKRVLSPGGLNQKHATLNNQCQSCHDIGDGSLEELTKFAFHTAGGEDQSTRCLKCHESLGPHPLNPHSIDFDVLDQKTFEMGGMHSHDQLACANCHQEHRGAMHDLTHLSDQQCQSCHTDAFNSFTHGHREFVNYPHEFRTPINFNHSSHYEVHFDNFERLMPEGKAPVSGLGKMETNSVSCQRCHQLDDRGSMMVNQGFDQMCASCHERQITDKDLSLELISLPLRSKTSDLGEKDFASLRLNLSPFTQALLSSDEEFSKLIVGSDESENEQLGRFHTAIEKLFEEVKQKGTQPLKRRLKVALSDTISDAEIERLVAVLPLKEMAELNEFVAQPKEGEEQGAMPSLSEEVGRVWHSSLVNGQLSLSYHPRFHADPLLTTLWESSTRSVFEKRDEQEANGQVASFRVPGSEDSIAERLFAQLSNPVAAGRCVKCHSVDVTSKKFELNWHGRTTEPSRQSTASFAHRTHLLLSANGDQCAGCHEMKKFESFFNQDYVHPLGHVLTDTLASDSVDFKTITKSNCAKCHKPQGARESCTTCHKYHQGGH